MSEERINVSPEAEREEGQVRIFYQQVLAGLGLAPLSSTGSPLMLFEFGGVVYGLTLVHASFLQLGVNYVGLRDSKVHLPNTFTGEVVADVFLRAANTLNTRFGDIQISIGDANNVFFNATSYLFSSIVPAWIADIDLPLVTPGAIEVLLSDKLIQLEIGAAEFFSIVGTSFSRTGRQPSAIKRSPPHNMYGASYFSGALEQAGHPLLNVGSEGLRRFFAQLGGWTFFLQSNVRAPWHYSAMIHFVERQRFEPETSLDNVFDGVVNDELLDILNSFNSDAGAVKSFVVLESGLVILSMTGTVPFLEQSQVSRQLRVLWDTLFVHARQLFARAGIEITSYKTELDERRKIQPAQYGLKWICHSTVNDFERLVGEKLATGVKGMYGRILTGFHITTDRDDVDLDNVLVCEAGVFLLECKNYSQRIKGSRSGKWKASGQRGSRTVTATRGQNPADQALSAALALLNYLKPRVGAERPFVLGVVVFPDNAILDIVDVSINQFLDNAPAVFQISTLVQVLEKGVSLRENRRLTPAAVDRVAYAITGPE